MIVDGADNFPTRYLLNDAAVRLRKPVVHASILGFDGQLSTFVPYEGPCYRCLYPQPPPADLAPSCGANGVLGVLPGIMGLLQANEMIKLITGRGEPLVGRLLLFEALATAVHRAEGPPRRRVPGLRRRRRPRDTEFEDYEALCAPAARLSARRLELGLPPMATVKIPPVLRAAAGGQSEVEVEGATVGEVLRGLAGQHPGDQRPALRRRRAS